MKQFIYGALSAFSVVAAYHLIKKMSDRNKTSAAASNSIPDNEVQIKPKRVSFNKEYIEERKELKIPSGVALISSRKKGIFYFKHEIENVLENTEDKIVIFDVHEYFKPVINSLGAKYTEISSDELKEDILDKYERAIENGSAELTNIAPLTERITCFNAQKDEDVDVALRYVFMKSKLTALSEYRNVWLYIPSWEIAHYHASKLLSVMGRSRMAGVIMTASIEIDDIIINDVVRHTVNNFDYLAFTDNIDKYCESNVIRELICIDKAYQFDINISQDEENELKCIAFELEHIMTYFL